MPDDAMDIEAWLGALGLGHYAAAFLAEGIGRTELVGLTSQDLKRLGVVALSHRRKLLEAIHYLESGKARPLRLPPDELPP